MKYIIPVGRKDTLLALANKRTETICKLMDNNHVDGLEDILRLVDRPVGTHEEIRNATEDQHINAISEWYDLIASACRWLQNIGLTLTDHVPVYWYDEQAQGMIWEYANELLTNPNSEYTYKGQRLFCSPIDYYAIELCPKLQEALLDCDTEEADRLMGIIKKAMEEYI